MALTAMLLRQSCRGWVSCNQNKLKNTKYKTRELYVDQHRSSDGQGTLDKTTLISDICLGGEQSRQFQLGGALPFFITEEFDDPTRRKTSSTSWTKLWPSLGVALIRPNDRVRHRSKAIARTTTVNARPSKTTTVNDRPSKTTAMVDRRQRLLRSA